MDQAKLDFCSLSSSPPSTNFIFGYQEVVWLLGFFIFWRFSESGLGCPQVPPGAPGGRVYRDVVDTPRAPRGRGERSYEGRKSLEEKM